MKILHVDTGRTWRGGQKQVFSLHRGLLERGVDSLLVCSDGGELQRRTADKGPAAQAIYGLVFALCGGGGCEHERV